MGVDVRKLRMMVIFFATLMSAATVCVAGVIGWVGLLIPHLARASFGMEPGRLTVSTALLGCDFLARGGRFGALHFGGRGSHRRIDGADRRAFLSALPAAFAPRSLGMKAIEITGLSFRHDVRDAAVLSDVSLDLDHGEIIAILGPNGAGKSTLVLCLLGFLPPGARLHPTERRRTSASFRARRWPSASPMCRNPPRAPSPSTWRIWS